MAKRRETRGGRLRRTDGDEYIKARFQTLSVIMEKVDPSLATQGSVDDKPCIVTVVTEAYLTVARPDIAAGCLKDSCINVTLLRR
jgi:hypothetical protein